MIIVMNPIIEINYLYFFIFQIFLNLFLFANIKKISNKIYIFDIPNERKVHKKKVPLLGGFFLFLNFVALFIFDLFFFNKIFYNEFYLFDYKLIIIFLFSTTVIFILGLLDDKYQISYEKKIIILLTVLFLNISTDENLQIDSLIFSITNFEINFYSNSVFFSLLCFLIYINAINMFDGINLQTSLTLLIIYIFFVVLNINLYFSIFLITFLIFFISQNFNGKIFLGDSGTLMLGYFTAFILIKFYNAEGNSYTVYSDYIVSFMILPVIDLLRQFFDRIIKGKNPFYPDNNHLHHRILRKYNYNIAIITIVILYSAPIFLNFLMDFKINIYLIFFSIIFYFIIIYHTRNNTSNKWIK